MIKNLPEHKVDIGQSFTSNEFAALHVSIQLFQLRLQCICTVALALIERCSKARCYHTTLAHSIKQPETVAESDKTASNIGNLIGTLINSPGFGVS